jgi:Na+-translocating ferredoxin:NAD+ oxidoreductase RnfD subunit
MIWLLGGLGSGRLHPVIIAHLLLLILFRSLLVPHLTLQRGGSSSATFSTSIDPGRSKRFEADGSAPAAAQARCGSPRRAAAQRLIEYTSPRHSPVRAFMSVETLIRDAMPPLEDLIVGGHPGQMGTSCLIAVIIGGLFMLYRGVIDYRIPLLIILSRMPRS